MKALNLAITAATLVMAVAQHPAVRGAARAVVANPRLRDAAIEAAKAVAYNAGRVARRVVPRSLIQ
jgi:hypothetical protein